MTLRRQLTTGFTLVALAGLLLASIVGALLVRQGQLRAAERSVAIITNVVTGRAQSGNLEAGDPQLERLVTSAGGRLLTIEQGGAVVSDTATGAASFEGETLPVRALLAAVVNAEQRPLIRQVRVRGESYFFSVVPLRTETTGERLIIAIPTASLMESWVSLLPGIVIVSGLGLALATMLGYRLSRRLTAPLDALNTAANGMAAGDYDSRVTTASDIKELQVLSSTFNTMADEVKSARQVQRDFLANVSHDLRTPLTSIQGFSQAMMDGTVPENQTQRVATIIFTEAGRLSRLVLDLLDLARIEAGRFTMNRRDLNLKEVLQQVKETFDPQAERSAVAMDFKIPSRALPLFADSDRLTQVFSNLLDNAITYSQQGGKNVKVTAKLGGVRSLKNYGAKAETNGHEPAPISAVGQTSSPETATPELEPVKAGATASVASASAASSTQTLPTAPVITAPVTNGTGLPKAEATSNGNGNGHSAPVTVDATPAPTEETGEGKLGRWWVEVRIADDGPGIPDDQKHLVFERFHRGDAARSGSGLGLGLAIAKEIVEAHGGDIAVEDNDPSGTAFVVRLPMKMW